MENVTSILSDLNKRTAFLEALNWDEQKLLELERYLYTLSIDFSLVHPSLVIQNVSEPFGEQVANLLSDEFKKIIEAIQNEGE